MSGQIILQTIIFITSAIICVPLAKRFGLSSVLGYLIAGILVGPYVLEFVGDEREDILHFAEFGVVIMLFLIGLEIEPSKFWKMRKSILGKGGLQLGLTMPIALFLLMLIGYNWETSVVVAMAVVLSSTAIVLQILKEKGLMNTSYGDSAFSTLLFQDIIVIPMLAVIPLLGSSQNIENSKGADDPYLLESLPLGFQTIVIILSVVLIILAGRYLVAPVLRWVAHTRLRELVIGSALLIVFSLNYLMDLVGLSPALGAFLGGVVLANSEFK
ncbi:MAG: cation:proton antiporter, partial [Desulfobulbia bacterium]